MNDRQQGFTLLEVMLALSVGALIMLSLGKTYPILRQQTVTLLRHYRLEQVMWQITHQISKDLRRAGFCAGICPGKAIQLSAYPNEAGRSCVLINYDLNRNGQIEGIDSPEAEWFGYRLRDGNIETQRGVNDCASQGWERILDQQEIRITDFALQLPPADNSEPTADRIQIRLAGHWQRWPQINYQLQTWVRAENL